MDFIEPVSEIPKSKTPEEMKANLFDILAGLEKYPHEPTANVGGRSITRGPQFFRQTS